MSDDKLRLPSGQGGLTRFNEDSKSKIELSPKMVVALVVGVMIIIILLHYAGGKLLL